MSSPPPPPTHAAADIGENAIIYSLADEWRVAKYFEARGRFHPSQLYGGTAMQGDLAWECANYVNAKLKELGLEPIPEERWRERTYSGTGCFTRASQTEPSDGRQLGRRIGSSTTGLPEMDSLQPLAERMRQTSRRHPALHSKPRMSAKTESSATSSATDRRE